MIPPLLGWILDKCFWGPCVRRVSRYIAMRAEPNANDNAYDANDNANANDANDSGWRVNASHLHHASCTMEGFVWAHM